MGSTTTQHASCSSSPMTADATKSGSGSSREVRKRRVVRLPVREAILCYWTIIALLGHGRGGGNKSSRGVFFCSEALARSFVPSSARNRQTFGLPRGGSTAPVTASKLEKGKQKKTTTTTSRRETMKCVLQAPPSSLVSSGNNNEDDDEDHLTSLSASISSSFSTEQPKVCDVSTSSSSDRLVPTHFIAETDLPTDMGHFRLRAYRVTSPEKSPKNKFVGNEMCVIYSADKPPFGRSGKFGTVGLRDVPVRIHDQCFTSEVFRSQRCDCKEQFNMALKYVNKHGGALIYLQQEGRGIGLANKVAAYALQDAGMDTVEANVHLGFPEDCRQYGVVPSILSDMGIDSIQLLTNNPRKVDRLRDLGVDVVDTIPMVVERANQYNIRYLETKHSRMNHTNFGAMLTTSGCIPMVSGGDTTGTAATNGAMTRRKKNGVMKPRKRNIVSEEYIMEWEEKANAVVSTLEDESQSGVSAADDGYCFGPQSVEDAIAAIARGELVVVVDDMDRENEGDFIMAADLVTPETMATIIRYSSGVVCVGMEGKRMDELKLPPMVTNNEDPKGTAFSVTVDATKDHGITTGISATDRAKTLQMLANGSTTSNDFHRPGHIFPLRAKEGGVLTRDGHTEASVDLARLAGLSPNGVLCEIVSEENPTEMARLPELKRFCKKHGYVLTSIVDIAQYRRDTGQ